MIDSERVEAELKPCPFCGSADVGVTQGGWFFWTRCRQCKAQGASEGTFEKAMTTWNTRAALTADEQPVAPKNWASSDPEAHRQAYADARDQSPAPEPFVYKDADAAQQYASGNGEHGEPTPAQGRWITLDAHQAEIESIDREWEKAILADALVLHASESHPMRKERLAYINRLRARLTARERVTGQHTYSYETVRGLVKWRDERIVALELELAQHKAVKEGQ